MNDISPDAMRQRAVQRYVSALDEGDLDATMAVLEQAVGDPVLDLMLVEINEAIEQEEGLTALAQDAGLVQQLLQRHFHSDLESTGLDEPPLTVGEVAARMEADRSVPASDRSAHDSLLRLSTPIPEFLSLQSVRKLAFELKVSASEMFWRVFRDTAIMMGIGRGQAQMSAARRQRARNPHRSQRQPRSKK